MGADWSTCGGVHMQYNWFITNQSTYVCEHDTKWTKYIYVILAYSVIMKKKISFYMLSFNEIPNIFKLNNKITNGTTDNIFKFSYTVFVSVWGVSVAYTICVLSLLKSCRNAACCSIFCTMTSYYILSRKVLFQI